MYLEFYIIYIILSRYINVTYRSRPKLVRTQ